MLQTLKNSTEPKPLIELAAKHLRGIVGDLTRRKRLQETKAQIKAQAQQLPHSQTPSHPGLPPASHQHPPQPLHQQLALDGAQADALGLTPAQAYALQIHQEARSNRQQAANGMRAYKSQAPGAVNGTGARNTPWEV